MKIAIQGEPGCFHQIAANKYFKKEVEVLSCIDFPTLVNEVISGKNCDMGIMAIENSIAGSIIQNYKLLQKSGLHIVGETYLPIQQNLIVLPGTKIQEIEEVHSHPMAIYQCREYLDSLDAIRLIEKEDTAGSVKEIKTNNWRNKAAIASTLAANIYDMEVLTPSIETNKQNYTRFLVVTKNEKFLESNPNKSSIYFSVPHQQGSLAKILTVISNYGINMSKLQSYPIVGEKWQYYFYLDLEYDDYNNYQNLYKELINNTTAIFTLGNYKNGLK